MSRTKIVGYLVALIAVVKIIIDALNGGGFDISAHWDELTAALGGLGLVFLRSGVDKAASANTEAK